MAKELTALGDRLLGRWQRLSAWPGGKWLFSFLLTRQIPYTGSISARICELAPGRARVKLQDRHKIRNHLNSIHAI
ncbi:MAG: DUF4442 domain-containing protein, partial [Gammaproteobacteria bacterium]|nr:DUF4442 domain-containing protein [Gammaproteobacteria bacterium]